MKTFTQAEVDAFVAAKLAEMAPKAKLAFGLSPKGVFTFSNGRGFPVSMSYERAIALKNCTEFWAFVDANKDKAQSTRKNYTMTPEYKADAAKIEASRANYKLSLAQ